MRLLLIEDSESLRRSLGLGLQKLGYSVDSTGNGAEGLSMALLEEYDLLILDLMLPHMDGMAILSALRKNNRDIRIIILSARNEPEDKTSGILAGADDYLSKPFSFDELGARLLNLMRRGSTRLKENKVVIQEFELDLQLKQLSYLDNVVSLTPNEYKIIECLFLNKGKVITSETISEHITGHYDNVSKNSIESHLSSARKKVKDVGACLPVKNKRGFGYIVAAN